LKPIAKWMAVFALLGVFGCGKKDPNKDLKPVDTSAGKPHPVKDAGEDSPRALK